MKSTLGVALTKCFFCGDDNEILLNQRLTQWAADRVRKMHGCVVSMHPCSKCEEWMKSGIILIVIDEAKSAHDWNIPPTLNEDREHWMPNPHRTGGFYVITEDAARRVFHPPELLESILRYRWSFIEYNTAVQIGLVKEPDGKTDS
jgi:hypothetical protein